MGTHHTGKSYTTPAGKTDEANTAQRGLAKAMVPTRTGLRFEAQESPTHTHAGVLSSTVQANNITRTPITWGDQ